MNFLDLILAAFLIYGCVRGLWNGFFIEMASFLSFLLGVFIAFKFSFVLQSMLKNHVSWTPQTLQIVAFALTFILVILGITVLAKSLTTLANVASLGLFNKLAGGFFGLLKTILILSISLNVFQKVNKNQTFIEKPALEKSLLYYPILEIAGIIYPSIELLFLEIKNTEVKS
jgi:membrane protein required for colicin V production